MLVLSLRMKNKKGLAPDLFDTVVIHSSLVSDVTGTDFWAHNGSTHDHVFATFECQILTRFSIEKLLGVYFVFQPYRKGS